MVQRLVLPSQDSSFFKYAWDIMILLQRSYFVKEIIVVPPVSLCKSEYH